LAQPLADDAEHNVVRDQLARIHRGLGCLAQRRAFRQRGAQQIARGNLRAARFLDQFPGLRTLAGSRRPQKTDSQRVVSLFVILRRKVRAPWRAKNSASSYRLDGSRSTNTHEMTTKNRILTVSFAPFGRVGMPWPTQQLTARETRRMAR